MMNPPISYSEAELTLPPGGVSDVAIAGDWFYLDMIEQPLVLSVNGAKEAICRMGTYLQGDPGKSSISTLRFRNTTTANVSLRVLFGHGTFSNNSNVVIQNPYLTLDAATADAIRGLPKTLNATAAQVVNAIRTFSGCASITIANNGSTTITVAGGFLVSGAIWTFAVPGRYDVLADIVIDATGGQCDVLTLTYPAP